jgi:hypothetical protein
VQATPSWCDIERWQPIEDRLISVGNGRALHVVGPRFWLSTLRQADRRATRKVASYDIEIHVHEATSLAGLNRFATLTQASSTRLSQSSVGV